MAQLAELVGVSAHTLRFYEKEKLLTPTRTPGGQRRYRPVDVEHVRRLLELRRTGMSLAQLREFCASHDAHEITSAQRLVLLEAREELLRAHLATLRRRLRETRMQIECERRSHDPRT